MSRTQITLKDIKGTPGDATVGSIPTLQSDGSLRMMAPPLSPSGTLLNTYLNGNSAHNIIGLTLSNGPILIRDNATATGDVLFGIQDDSGSIPYLTISAGQIVAAVPTTFGGVLSIDTDLSGNPTLTSLSSKDLNLVSGSGVVSITGDLDLSGSINTVTPVELGYVHGVTSSIQSQLDSKVTDTRLIDTTAPLQGGGDLSTDLTLSIPKADASTDGYLSASDWIAFSGGSSTTIQGAYSNGGAGPQLITEDSTRLGVSWKAYSGQTTDIMQWRDSADNIKTWIDRDGVLNGAEFKNSAADIFVESPGHDTWIGPSSNNTRLGNYASGTGILLGDSTNQIRMRIGGGPQVFSAVVGTDTTTIDAPSITGTIHFGLNQAASAVFDVPVTMTSTVNGTTIPTSSTLVTTARAINTTSPLQGGSDLSSDLTLSIPQADGSTDGYLSSTDWTTFNNGVASLSGYAFLAGRSGGQQLNGGTNTGEALTLINNSVDNTALSILFDCDGSGNPGASFEASGVTGGILYGFGVAAQTAPTDGDAVEFFAGAAGAGGLGGTLYGFAGNGAGGGGGDIRLFAGHDDSGGNGGNVQIHPGHGTTNGSVQIGRPFGPHNAASVDIAGPSTPTNIYGDLYVGGKLTVVGAIDPTSLSLTGASKFISATDAGPLLYYPHVDQADAHSFRKSDGSTAILSIDTSSGFVGIDTDTPAYPLDVVGDINASGNLSAANFSGAVSGTNTGDQSITLIGDVTAGPLTDGSFPATIANSAVTYAKIQNVSATNRLLGRSSACAGTIEELTVGSGLSLSGGTLTATGSGGGTVTSVATDSTLTGGPITTTGTLGIDLTHANSWTGRQTLSSTSIGSTIPASGNASGVGLDILNATAATSGATVQATASLRFEGSAWNSSGGGSAERHDWTMFALPATAAGTTSSTFFLGHSIAGGAYTALSYNTSDRLNLPSGGTYAINGTTVLSGTSLGSAVQVGTASLNSGTSASNTTFWRGDGTWAVPAPSKTVPIGISIDGANKVVSTGVQQYFYVPMSGTIKSVTMLADRTGSCVIDIWKVAYSAFPTISSSNSITASAKPTISSAQKSQDTTLSGWTTSISAGDILAYNVDSASTIHKVTLILEVQI